MSEALTGSSSSHSAEIDSVPGAADAPVVHDSATEVPLAMSDADTITDLPVIHDAATEVPGAVSDADTITGLPVATV